MGDEADDDHFELIGQVIDDQKITIKSVVGKGGFSVVYEGWHHVFDERVAIKCLKVPGGYSKAQIRDYFANFRREGQLLLKLTKSTHNVVRIFNMGEITRAEGGSVPYLVLEWLAGEGLDEWVARRSAAGKPRLSLPEMIALLDAGAEALAKAHAMGVAHRDVKPPNFQVSAGDDGRETVKLLDFGIAKQFDAHVPASRLETQLGAGLAYTPAYGSPEQFARDFQRGRVNLPATGPHSDVFSLALVCVELLTGRAPLGDDDNRLVLHHEATRLDRRPTPKNLGADVPADVEAVFERALAVEIEGRYESVAEFWRALHIAAGVPAPAWLERVGEPSSRPTFPAAMGDRRSSAPPPASKTLPTPIPGAPPRPGARRSRPAQEAAIPVLRPLFETPQTSKPAAPKEKEKPKEKESRAPASQTAPILLVQPKPPSWSVAARVIVLLLVLAAGSVALYYARGGHKAPAPASTHATPAGSAAAPAQN